MPIHDKPFDQAQTLRAWHQQAGRTRPPQAPLQVIAVASGKGGVGKTSLVANFAIAFAQQGLRVLTVDGDMGLGNLDIAFGVHPQHSLFDVLSGAHAMDAITVPVGCGVTLLPGCSGRYELANLSERDQQRLLASIDVLENDFDVVLVDTAAGIGSNAVTLAAAAQQIVIVATPEPTSMADAYAFVKVLSTRCRVQHFQLLANMVRSPQEGHDLFVRLSGLFDRFLHVSVDYLGCVPTDPNVGRSLRLCTPLLLHAPYAPASQSIKALCHKLSRTNDTASLGGMRLFWRRLLQERGAL